MKDRIPARPGRIKLTKDDGAVEYAVMERADEPTQQGTPLNKATLLADDTAAMCGKGIDAVVDDALKALAQKVLHKQIFIQSSQDWVAPNNILNNKIWVRLFGGGGGGNYYYSSSSRNGGGGGHMSYEEHTIVPGTAYTVIIGAGGAAASSSTILGGVGGTTSFNEQSADGGNTPPIINAYDGNNGGSGGGGYIGRGGKGATDWGAGGGGYGNGGDARVVPSSYSNIWRAGFAGGGAGCCYISGSTRGATPGGDGICIIEYFEAIS